MAQIRQRKTRERERATTCIKENRLNPVQFARTITLTKYARVRMARSTIPIPGSPPSSSTTSSYQRQWCTHCRIRLFLAYFRINSTMNSACCGNYTAAHISLVWIDEDVDCSNDVRVPCHFCVCVCVFLFDSHQNNKQTTKFWTNSTWNAHCERMHGVII